MASRRIRALSFSLLIGTLAAPAGWAGPILDQFAIPPSPPLNGFLAEDGQTLAQTFTVGLRGRLSAIELDLACCLDRDGIISFPADLMIEIRTTRPDGAPSEHVLAATAVNARDLSPGFFTFERIPLASYGIDVLPGDVLAIVLSSTAPGLGLFNPYTWALETSGAYDRGDGYVRHTGDWSPSIDFGFKTYVPEPATTVLIGLALAALAGRQARTKQARRPARPTGRRATSAECGSAARP
jgi:hypothetical protein